MNSYTKIDLYESTRDTAEDDANTVEYADPEAEAWAATLKEGDFVLVCNDCGAQSEMNSEVVKHYATCKPGECKRWEKINEEFDLEVAANLAKDPHYYDPYEDDVCEDI